MRPRRFFYPLKQRDGFVFITLSVGENYITILEPDQQTNLSHHSVRYPLC
jgi:hypothetical protein